MTPTCPYCKYTGPTVTSTKITDMGWIVFIILLLVCFPLCWLPFVMDGLKTQQHKCASCGIALG